MTAPPINTTAYKSPNFNDRPSGTIINAIVVHTTEGSWDSDIEWMCNPTTQVSCHYVIAPDGKIYQIVDPAKRAWHAGETNYLGRSNWNNFSIGIEVSHRQGNPWGHPQHPALSNLCTWLISRYPIPREYVVTHRKIAVPLGRKIDPTDMSDAEFNAWADSLYAPTDPLATHSLPGALRPMKCSKAVHDFYYAPGRGFALFGYATADEHEAVGANGVKCAVTPCERAVIKSSTQYGVELALLSEAEAQGWSL